MAPSKSGTWFALLIAWVFATGVYALWNVVAGEVSLIGYLLIFSFPLLITYYALRGIYGDSGKLVLERRGFTLTLPSEATEFFHWERVECFGTHIFGDPVVTQTGIATARFAYAGDDKDRRVVGLTNNLPYAGEDLARIMEYARHEAAKGWPNPPKDLTGLALAALGSPGETSLPARLTAQSTKSSDA